MAADAPRDEEKGEAMPLVSERERLLKSFGSLRGETKKGSFSTLVEVPVGGIPGNAQFYKASQLAIRLTVVAMLLGTLVWLPEFTKSLDRFSKHASLAVCLMIFFAGPTVGAVLNNASAGVSGCFLACVNIFLLRGFFPDGVSTGMGHTSLPSIIGWADVLLYNLFVLGFNCRMGFRMTAMALNVNFMMCFLNPEDQTVFSKNFRINPNGAAVSAFLGTCLGSVGALAAICLPYPLGFSTSVMKSSGKSCAEDMCKLFISSVRYFKGTRANALIERQLAESDILKTEILALETNINDAYVESFDVRAQGTIRALYYKHSVMLGEMFNILNSLQMAMLTEDFGTSHTACMDVVGEPAHDLVDEAVILLTKVTRASEDGIIDEVEKVELEKLEAAVTQKIRGLSVVFDDARRKFGKPVCKELMNESFFVFALSAFGRLVTDYSITLRTDPPSGKEFFGEVKNSIRDVVKIPVWYHYRIVSRYWLSLFFCFVFAVFVDGYSPACAITAVFLINVRVGPDVMAMISGLLAVVVGVVTNALMYSFSCKFGNTYVLMGVCSVWWTLTIFVAFGGSSLANIGLWMAALASFAVLKLCQPVSDATTAAAAVGLWGAIRALIIAVAITIIMEVIHVPGMFTRMAAESLDDAFTAMGDAFHHVWPEEDIGKARDNIEQSLNVVSKSLADTELYSNAGKMEPRLHKCPWKSQFVTETVAHLKKIRLDVLIIEKALCGLDGKMERIVELFNKVPAGPKLKKDLNDTMEGARKLTKALLEHEHGPFEGLKLIDTVEGINELEGFDEALDAQCELLKFPSEAPASMEGDELCQMSILFVMLDYLIIHVADITMAAVKLS
jgi:hypothetical protein